MNSIEIFEKYAQEYDEWFEVNRFAYESEIRALKMFIPKNRKGLEVGVGTGRFAVSLGIRIGVEPAENLTFDDSSFDFVLIMVTICFVQDPVQALREAKRVLKPGGDLIIGMINKESFLGKLYESKKKESKFYRHANFYSTRQVLDWLIELEFEHIKTCQTIFNNPKEITAIEPVKEGYEEGGFIVISAQKKV